MDSPIGVAVLGLGRMGRLYARLLGGLPSHARLVGVADPEPLALAAVQAELAPSLASRDPFCPPASYADPASSGGLLMDMGIHDFDLARWLMTSEVERVSAEGALLVCDQLRQVGDVDNAVVTLRFASGALGTVEVSRTAAYAYDIRTEVLGSEGVVLIGADGLGGRNLVTRGRATVNRETFLLERFGPAYQAQLEAFLTSVRRQQPPAVTGHDALAAARIAWAATQALNTGAPVAVEHHPVAARA